MKNQNPSQEHLQSIINLYKSGEFKQALSESSQMLERFPNSVSLYNISGASNAALMQFDAAIKSYKQALKIKPDYAGGHFNMGSVLKDKGDLEEAIKSYKQALKIKPDYVDAYNNLGNAFKDKGDLEEAIKSYKQALKIKPDYAESHNNLGAVFHLLNQNEQALESYKKALSFRRNFKTANSGLGIALLKKGKHIEGLDKLRQGDGCIIFNIRTGLLIKY